MNVTMWGEGAGKGEEEEEEEVRIKVMRTRVYLKAAAEDEGIYHCNFVLKTQK